MATAKNLVKFNVQNAAYAIPSGEAYGTPKSFGTSRNIALEPDSSKKNIYGDGRVICVIRNDKGKTGTLGVNLVPDDYDIDMKRKLRTANGLATIKQAVDVKHCIYFETKAIADDDTQPIAKTWLYGVTSDPAAESYDQTEDDINESTFDIPLEIRGTPLLNADGSKYIDEKGNEVYVWQMTVTPDDPNFDTFGDAVVLPEMPASGG